MRRCSSVAERLHCKQRVRGSSPFIGWNDMNRNRIVKNLIGIMAMAKRLNARVNGGINKKTGDMYINIHMDKIMPPCGVGTMKFTLKTLDLKGLRAKYLGGKP